MKIGLVGFFGWGNFGDELFIKAHRQYLGDIATLEPINNLIKKPYFTKAVNEVVENFDAFIIGGGDLITPWTVSELYWKIEYLEKPVFVTGIGVPKWGGYNKNAVEKYRKFFQSDSIKTFIGRDKESADWINKHVKPSILCKNFADLICALDLPEPPQSGEKILGVSLRSRRGGEDDFTEVRRLCDSAKKMGYTIKHIVLANQSTGKKDYNVIKKFAANDEEILYSESLDEMCMAIGQCSAFVSMKFHGTVVASMYGIPSIILSATDKNLNFSRLLERPDLVSSFKDKYLHKKLAYEPVRIHSQVRNMLRDNARRGYDVIRHSIQMEFKV